MADIMRGKGPFCALLHLNLILAWRPPKTGKVNNLIGTLLFFGVFFILGLVFFGTGLVLSIHLHSVSKQVRLLAWGGAILLALFTFLILFTDGLSQGNDPTPLFYSPVSATQLLLAELIARIAGPPVLPPLGFFVGSTLGIVYSGHYLAALLSLLGMFLWIFQVFLLLTAADYLLFNLRRSRHFTEFIWLVSGLLVGLWLVLQFWIHSGRKINDAYFEAVFLKLQAIWPSIEHVAFFFPGLSPVAWVTGNAQSLFFLLAAVAEIFLILKLGGHSLRRLMENGTGTNRKKKKNHPLRRDREKAGTGAGLSFWPFAAKETHYLARDPQLKMMLLNVLAGPLSILIVFSTPKSGFSIRAIEYGVPFLFLMYMGPFVFNNLAIERDGLMTTLLSPFPRWKLFAGKNFVYFIFYLLLLIPVTVILAFKGIKPPALAADWACFLPLALIFFGAGNLLSLFMPIPMIATGKRLRANLPGGRKWFFSLIRLFINGALLLIAAPLFIGRFAILHFWHQPWITLPVLLLMTAYGTVFYYFLL
ncbi:MAG: hypothetical protein GXO70_06755, partial [Acidobacteria bacterium]|nr:hypothetical protein [Acidobacteriota bacterium]